MGDYTQKSKKKEKPFSRNESSLLSGSSEGPVQQLVDNRPEAVAQRKMKEAINNSPRVLQAKARQEMLNNSPRVLQLKQRQEQLNNSPRVLQMKGNQPPSGEVVQRNGNQRLQIKTGKGSSQPSVFVNEPI